MFNTLFNSPAGRIHIQSGGRARHGNQFASCSVVGRQLSGHAAAALPVGGRAAWPWPPQGPPAAGRLPQGGAAAHAADDRRHRRVDSAGNAGDGRVRSRTLPAARGRDLPQLGGRVVHQGSLLPTHAPTLVQERQLTAEGD